MDSTLILNLEQSIIDQAEIYAREKKTTLTALINNYLLNIVQGQEVKEEEITPLVRSLSGVLNLSENTSLSSDYVDSEIYIYGRIISMGGKNKSTLEIDTTEYGILSIESEEDTLKESPYLYKKVGLEVLVKENPLTGQIKKDQIRLIKVIEYDPSVDQEYLNKLISEASPRWKDIGDVNHWLDRLRHGESID
jgi:Family of unknown function (DUF6364)